MSTAGLFRDYLDSGTALDENTVITDYWLDFVSAREEMEEPTQTPAQSATEDLCERMLSFGQKIEALLEGHRQIRIELKKITGKSQPLIMHTRFGESGTSSSLESRRGSKPARSQERPHSPSQEKISVTQRTWSLADRLRSSFLYTTIQKLR
jgi:hypothetical protein